MYFRLPPSALEQAKYHNSKNAQQIENHFQRMHTFMTGLLLNTKSKNIVFAFVVGLNHFTCTFLFLQNLWRHIHSIFVWNRIELKKDPLSYREIILCGYHVYKISIG